RHTRLVSDWSSDVCSSDLSRSPVTVSSVALAAVSEKTGALVVPCTSVTSRRLSAAPGVTTLTAISPVWPIAAGPSMSIEGPEERSEERRVGKEGGERGGAE